MLDLLDLCREHGMMVLLLAHMGTHNVKHPTHGDYMKFAPDVDKTCWARVSKWSDVIGRADYEYVVVKDRGQSKGRAVGTNTRRLFFAGSAAVDAKCRVGYELPDELTLSWADVAANLGKDPTTLKEVQELWPILTEQESAAALRWLGAETLEEASLHRLRQLLNRLREKQGELVTQQAQEGDAE